MKTLVHGKAVEKVDPAAGAYAVETIARLVAARQRLWTEARETSARLDVLKAVVESQKIEIARLRTFIRSARPIVQSYASNNPIFTMSDRCPQDPMGAHAWLEAEATEIGTMRDGGDPKVEGAAS
jgi:hypothetical protein